MSDGQFDNPSGGDRVGLRRRQRRRERVEDASDTRIVRLRKIGTGELAVDLAERAGVFHTLTTCVSANR